MISIVVPVYNVEHYISKCIESIISQTYRDIEIILVDDGSTDNCGVICDEYAKKDERIIVFHIKNSGLSAARNYGITNSKGDYIGFVDGDDWIETDMFENLMNLVKVNKSEIAICGYYDEYPSRTHTSSIVQEKFTNSIDLVKALINGNINNSVWNKLYQRSCFENILFPIGHVREDIFTLYKIFLKTSAAVSVSMPLYHYRKNRQESIIQSDLIDNLIDYWLANKSRYDYFLGDSCFNTDKDFMNRLIYLCVLAAALNWRLYYSRTVHEQEKYALNMEEIRAFCVQKVPFFGLKKWPLHIRFTIIIGRLNNKYAFAFLYYLLQSYRWIRDNLIRTD